MAIALKPEIQESISDKTEQTLKQLRTNIISLILNYQLYSNDNLFPHDYLLATLINVLQEQPTFCLNLSIFDKLLPFSSIFKVKIDKNKYAVKQNYITIISNFFSIKQNVFHLLVSVVNYIIVNKEHISVIYFLIRIIFFHNDQNIYRHLVFSFNLTEYFDEILMNERVKEKYFNFFLQFLLSTKKFVIEMNSLKYQLYPVSLVIKNLILVLDTKISNKDRLRQLRDKKIVLDAFSVEGIDTEMFFAVINNCNLLLDKNAIGNAHKTINVQEREDYNQSYSILIQFVNKLLEIDHRHIIYTSLFSAKEPLCKLIFLNAIIFNIQCEESLIAITKDIILKNQNPFVFELLKSLISNHLRPDILLSLAIEIYQLISSMALIDEPYLTSNIIHYTLFIDFFIKTNANLYHSNLFAEKNLFGSMIKILKDNCLLYSKMFLTTDNTNEPKIMMDIVFDLFILHYTNTKKKTFLDDMIEFFVINNIKCTRIKNRTIIMSIDYKTDSGTKAGTLNADQELVKLFPQNPIKNEYSDIKFTMYFLIKILLAINTTQQNNCNSNTDSNILKDKKENSDSFLIEMYDKIGISLCKDISFLIDKNEIREETDYIPQYQELLKKFYLFYKTNGSYEKLKNAYLNYFSNTEKSRISLNLFIDSTVFQINTQSLQDKALNDKESIHNNIDTSSNKEKNINSNVNTNSNCSKSNEYGFIPQSNSKAANIEAKEKEYELTLNTKLSSPNKTLIQTTFGLYFKNILFYNEEFIKMKQYYIKKYNINPNTKKLPYPSQRKNFSNTYSPHLFLKQNRSFFSNSYFRVSHKYYIDNLPYVTPQYFTLQKRPVKIEKFIYTVQCELITADHSHFGTLKTTNDFIIFQGENCSSAMNFSDDVNYIFCSMKSDRLEKSAKTVIILYSNICEIITRRYLLMWQAIEIYRQDGKSFFFNLFKSDERKKLFEHLKTQLPNTIIIEDSIGEFKKRKYAIEWSNNALSTYAYLLQINKFASRTFNDIHQYFVFPWVLSSYFNIDNEAQLDYRLFDRPISFQRKTENQLPNQSTLEKSFEKFIGGNFSTGPFVQYYMMRSTPYVNQLIRFQGKKLDVPDRVFISYDSLLKDLFVSSDNRELVPELFSQCEPYINFNCISFGKTQKQIQIDDIGLTHLKNNDQPTLASYVNYFMCLYNILNSDAIAKGIPLWLDYYFGVKQNLLKEKFHICSKYSYEAKAILDARMEKHKLNNQMSLEISLAKINEKIQLIYTLGQTPCQVIQSTQLQKKKSNKKEKASYIDNSSMLSSSSGRQNDIIYFMINKQNTMIYSINLARELTIYQLNDMKKITTIRCKKFKLLKKGFFDRSSFSCTEWKNKPSFPYAFYIFEPKYAFAVLNSKIVLTCRYLDRSFKLQNMKSTILREVLTDSFVNCLRKVNHHRLLTGLRNGKLMEWKIDYDASLPLIDKGDICLTLNRSIIAHEGGINVIMVSQALKIIVTAGNDNYILIRKLYDFELLTSISIEGELIVGEIMLSHFNLLYVLCFNKYSHLLCIKGYTLTGLLFATSAYDYYNHYESMANGNITVGYYDKNIISYLDGSTLERKNDVYLSKKSNAYKFMSYKYIPEIQKYCLFYSALIRKNNNK